MAGADRTHAWSIDSKHYSENHCDDLKARVRERGISQEKLAALLRVDEGTVRREPKPFLRSFWAGIPRAPVLTGGIQSLRRIRLG